ncbi:MAG: HEAT repeat domain-containing protein [Planctomycetes bacterium]|nr:HEAT repeat domain-containing protein [Planctomycetota bacterium]MBI3847116.1 HEAT repeat domain-containing protein [Planctomycetota bacterium]
MNRLLATLSCALVVIVVACHATNDPKASGDPLPDPPHAIVSSGAPAAVPRMSGRTREEKHHLLEVQTSAFCGTCHPDIYQEHTDNTHGRAFTDPEARLATNDFFTPDFCIVCHTPRPTLVTGIGQNPIRRWHNLEEGDTCMTCHQKAGVDLSRFQGGAVECKNAFDPRVSTQVVEACGTCHRNHGTPYQWAESPIGGKANRPCVECHMRTEFRPPAVGVAPRLVRSHVFPASHSEHQVRSAYQWRAEVKGNEAVVTISNIGAGHNFPTELRQRNVESVILVKDLDGNYVRDSKDNVLVDRMTFRDPYKRPYGFKLQTNTQIPSGETREHKLGLPIAEGKIEVSLYFKIYWPADDNDPHLSRLLEHEEIPFSGVTPQPIVTNPHPAPPTPSIDLPTGTDEKSLRELLAVFQFPVPEAAAKAKQRAVEIGAPIIPYLVEDLGIWDQKTWLASEDILIKLGKPAIPAVLATLESPSMYARIHAREVLAQLQVREAIPKIVAALRSPAVDDVVSAARALGTLRATEAASDLRPLLDHDDPDVVQWSARSLARIGDREAIAPMKRALDDAFFPETRVDLSIALGDLGDGTGIPVLIDLLSHRDAIIRTYASEGLMRLTGHYFGYLARGNPKDRDAATERFKAWWASVRESYHPLPPPADAPPDVLARADDLALNIGGSDLKPRDPDYDAKAIPELAAMGEKALFSLIDGMRYAEGFVEKRKTICGLLGNLKRREAVPALCKALLDTQISVNIEALRALRQIGFPEALGDVTAFEDRTRRWLYNGGKDEDYNSDAILKEIALTRDALGDSEAPAMWIELLRSPHNDVRKAAISAIRTRAGQDFGFDPEADPSATDAAVGTIAVWWEAARRAPKPARQ